MGVLDGALSGCVIIYEVDWGRGENMGMTVPYYSGLFFSALRGLSLH